MFQLIDIIAYIEYLACYFLIIVAMILFISIAFYFHLQNRIEIAVGDTGG